MKHKIASPVVAGRLLYGPHIQKLAGHLIKITDYRGRELFHDVFICRF